MTGFTETGSECQLRLERMETESHSGASLFWTLEAPEMHRARELVESGLLTEAEAVLASAGSGGSPELARACREGREIIRRIRREYSLDIDELLSRIRRRLPDVTADDVERWRQSGQVQHRVLDGRLWYWQREPSNVWKLCDEARRRLAAAEGRNPDGPPAISEGQRKLMEHLARVVAAARGTGKIEVEPVRHTIRHKLTVHPDRPGAGIGSHVRCWLPYPQEYRQQREVRLIRTAPAECVIAPPAVDTWPMPGAPQRTVYLEQPIADPAQPVVFFAEYEFVSRAYYPLLDDAQARPDVPEEVGVYLRERPPHIRFTSELRETVDRIVSGEPNPLARARRIFFWFDANVRYAFEEEYSTIPSFCEKLLRVRRGDCGVQAMLFVAMCRLAGVPARWQSGWATFPANWNMHDWAEIYVAPWGWLPVDVSYGLKPSDDPAVREFYFGHQDSYRLIVNLDYGCELHPPKSDLRSETADFQRGEVEIDGRNLYFDEWDYEFGFDATPVGE